MSSSELSSPLSSLASDDGEIPPFMLDGAADARPKADSSDELSSPAPSIASSAPKRKRPESPPHEEVLADNQDIAFIVMFRSRFSDAFPPKLINFGPQDIERGVVDSLPTSQVEGLLCALLALVLNRKKPVERGHYGRALEEAIQTQKSQWPRNWNGINPLTGGRTFNTMNPQERLNLLKALILWALNTSDAITAIIKDSYKQNRHDDDLNQPLSVHPWGRDGDKRRYWLIEGRDDTPFRLYRESNPALKTHTWWSVAGTIDELRVVAEKLKEDGTQAARRLADRILVSIPRFEATEEKRKRREYRMLRRAQFQRPEPGYSLYEGRTRGKRMRYTFDDEEDEDLSLSDALPARRSTRHSGAAPPAELGLPTVTASGRQVRARVGGVYGETLHSGQHTSTGRLSPATDDYQRSDVSEEPPIAPGGRSTRTSGRTTVNGWARGGKHIEGYNSLDEMDDEDEASSSGAEWEGGDEEEPDEPDNDIEMEISEEDDFDDVEEGQSLVVKLRYHRPATTDAIRKIESQTPEPFSTGNATLPSINIQSPTAVTNNPINRSPMATRPMESVLPSELQTNGDRKEQPPVATLETSIGFPGNSPTQPSQGFQSVGFGQSTLPYSPPKPVATPTAPVPQASYPTPASSETANVAPPF